MGGADKESRIAADAGRRLPVIVNLGYPRGTVAVPLPLNSGARAVRAGSSAKAAVRAPHFHYPGRAGAAAESAKSASARLRRPRGYKDTYRTYHQATMRALQRPLSAKRAAAEVGPGNGLSLGWRNPAMTTGYAAR